MSDADGTPAAAGNRTSRIAIGLAFAAAMAYKSGYPNIAWLGGWLGAGAGLMAFVAVWDYSRNLSVAIRLVATAFGGGAFLVMLLLFQSQMSHGASFAISGAKAAVKEVLKAPSSASFVEERILLSKDSDHAVWLSVDAENSFGATLRSCFVVLIGDRFSPAIVEGAECSHDSDFVATQAAFAMAMHGWDERPAEGPPTNACEDLVRWACTGEGAPPKLAVLPDSGRAQLCVNFSKMAENAQSHPGGPSYRATALQLCEQTRAAFLSTATAPADPGQARTPSDLPSNAMDPAVRSKLCGQDSKLRALANCEALDGSTGATATVGVEPQKPLDAAGEGGEAQRPPEVRSRRLEAADLVGVASSELTERSGFTNAVARLFDGDPDTAWAEGVAGTGVGEWFGADLRREFVVTRVGVGPGHAKLSKKYGRLFELNSRPARLRMRVGDWEDEVTLRDDPNLQWVDVPQVSATEVRLAILAVYEGSRWPDTTVNTVEIEVAQ